MAFSLKFSVVPKEKQHYFAQNAYFLKTFKCVYISVFILGQKNNSTGNVKQKIAEVRP
jgi:hypothetical protein